MATATLNCAQGGYLHMMNTSASVHQFTISGVGAFLVPGNSSYSAFYACEVGETFGVVYNTGDEVWYAASADVPTFDGLMGLGGIVCAALVFAAIIGGFK